MEHTLGYLKEQLIGDVDFYLLTDGPDNASFRSSAEECDDLLAQKQAQNWRFWKLDMDHGPAKREYRWKNDVSFAWKKL